MSNQKHNEEVKLNFWIDKNLLKNFDLAYKINGYKNRADWFREQIRREINIAEKRKEKELKEHL